jgi:hypothetical protein
MSLLKQTKKFLTGGVVCEIGPQSIGAATQLEQLLGVPGKQLLSADKEYSAVPE